MIFLVFPWVSHGLTSPAAYPPSGWKLLHFALPIRCQAHRDHPDLVVVRCGFSFGIKNGRYKIHRICKIYKIYKILYNIYRI
jgi:hypothetical protein